MKLADGREPGSGRRRPGLFGRAGRRTNAWLLWLLVGSFVTGWLSFAAGGGVPATLTRVGHGVFGLGVVVLAPWKTTLVRRARRFRPTGVLLVVLVLACLVGGCWQLVAGWAPVAGVSAIQVHVGAALVGVPLLVWHVLRHRRQRLRRTDLSRRTLLRGTVSLAAVGAGYLVLSALAHVSAGPERRPVATGSRVVDSPVAPDGVPATIWLADRVPILDAGRHRVRVGSTDLSVADLRARSVTVAARLDCTSGWYADARWTGVPLSALLPASALVGARSLVVRSATGYTRTFPVQDAADLWLAVARDGEPLSVGTGSPVRLVAPGRRGFWWVKWVASVQPSRRPSWLQPPFPLQ